MQSTRLHWTSEMTQSHALQGLLYLYVHNEHYVSSMRTYQMSLASFCNCLTYHVTKALALFGAYLLEVCAIVRGACRYIEILKIFSTSI